VRPAERRRIRKIYRDLSCRLKREFDDKDDFRVGEDCYITFLYGGPGAKELDKVLPAPEPHLYFQAPRGKAFRLVGINEDLSRYEGLLSTLDRSEVGLEQASDTRFLGGIIAPLRRPEHKQIALQNGESPQCHVHFSRPRRLWLLSL